MTRTPARSSGPLSRRAALLVGVTWTTIGVIGCLLSAWISTQAIAEPLRFALVAFMVVCAYWLWFRVLRAVGAVDRGVFGTISAAMDDVMGTPGRQ